MGQEIGKIQSSPEAMKIEWDRVVQWSVEVLARIYDTINAENSILIEHNESMIGSKVDHWLRIERQNVVQTWQSRLTSNLESEFLQLNNELKSNMQKDYEETFEDLRRFTKLLDDLVEEQEQIHKQLLSLEKLWLLDEKKFRRKLNRLRMNVFKNIKKSEKMIFQDKKLRNQFIKKVSDIDEDNMERCKRKARRLIKKDFQKTL